MASDSEKAARNNGSDKSPEDYFVSRRKEIDKYSLFALFTLIIAVILLSFELNLISGIMIIASATIGLLVFRKSSALNNKIRESLNAFSLLSEKKDEVITDFSHRIREPLNNLVVIEDMLLESGLQKKQKELLETFIASTNNMVTIMNELSMKSAGNLSFQKRKSIKFNFLSTIQNTIELYNLKDKASIDFILNKKDLSDLDCFGDPIILKQIFLDLFNTIESQISEKPTKVTINLKKEKEDRDESHIGFRIQTDKSILLIDNTGSEPGLASRLIDASRGRFSQEIGNNSTVLTILLPFVSPLPDQKQKISSRKIEELMQKEKTHKEMKDLNILLVEDDLINQKITLLTLRSVVNSIETATNGKEAVDKFGTKNYDLILMDIKMPVMSGLIAAEKIRALELTSNTHVPIIALTAYAMIGDKEKCISAGIDDYITKPFQPAVLISKIKNFL